MKTICLDLLCFNSVIRVIFLSRNVSIEKVYFVNKTKFFSKIYIKALSACIQKPVEPIVRISEADEKINGISLYEYIQIKLRDVLDVWFSIEKNRLDIEKICGEFGFDFIKYNEFLRESFFWLIFRPVSMSVFAEKFFDMSATLFVLHYCPWKSIYSSFLKKEQIYFYKKWFYFEGGVEKRKDSYYDTFVNPRYFSTRLGQIILMSIHCSGRLVSSLLCSIFQKEIPAEVMGQSNIGIELVQPRVRLDKNNNLFWLKSSGIDPRSVWGIQFKDYDQQSIEILEQMNIRRCQIINSPLSFFSLRKKNKDFSCFGVTISIKDSLESFLFVGKMLMSFDPEEKGWMRFEAWKYCLKTKFWMSIYKQLGIKLLWSVTDLEDDKLPKAQAIKNGGGLYMGTFWGIHPMPRIDLQRSYDVLFSWGPYFRRNVFKYYPFMTVFDVGFPSDYCFAPKEQESVAIRNKFSGKYIISYHDNTMAQDLMFSASMQIKIYKMFILLLEKYENLVLFLKPKRKSILDSIILEFSVVQEYIGKKRIEVFLGEKPSITAFPATIGMASDLVVGLGISTSATECFLAGAIAFYAEFTGFERNEFAQRGLNKIVFHDTQSLEKAICQQIEGKGITYEECKPFYQDLDPFQDGKAFERIAFVIKKLHDYLDPGMSREDLVEKVKQEYEQYIQAEYQESLGSSR